MNTKTAIKGSAVALALILLSGCASQERIQNLETKVGALEQDVSMAKSDAANAAAALQAAQAAEAAANEALSAARASQSCCDATNEKMDRMFQRSQSK